MFSDANLPKVTEATSDEYAAVIFHGYIIDIHIITRIISVQRRNASIQIFKRVSVRLAFITFEHVQIKCCRSVFRVS